MQERVKTQPRAVPASINSSKDQALSTPQKRLVTPRSGPIDLDRLVQQDLLPRLALFGGAGLPGPRTGQSGVMTAPRLVAGAATLTRASRSTRKSPSGRKRGTLFASVALIEDLGQSLIARDDIALARAIDRQVADGQAYSEIVEGLLAPIARYLGECWAADTCSFVDVTVAVGSLEAAARRLSAAKRTVAGFSAAERSILLTMAPGEQHIFGLTLVAEAFERAGWHVTVLTGPNDRDPLSVIAGRRFDVLGITIGGTHDRAALKSWVQTLRTRSAQSDVRVLVGGNDVVANPDLVAAIGADATAEHAGAAVLRAETLVGQMLACA